MDKIIIRMSGSGKCPRALSAELLGYEKKEPPAWLEQTAEEGYWHEARIIQELWNRKYVVTDKQEEMELEYDNFKLIGHIDGTIYMDLAQGDKRLLEIKSMSQFQFDKWMKERWQAFHEYAAQITCYMEATGLEECLYIVKNRNSGYKDEQILTKPPLDINDIITDISNAIDYASKGLLCPAEFNPNSTECKQCSFPALCIPEPQKLDDISQEALDKACQHWRVGIELEKQGVQLQDKAKEVFAVYTTEVPKFRYGGLAITKSHVVKRLYNRELLEQTFEPEQLLPAIKTTEYDMIRVTDLEKERGKKNV